MTDSKTRAKRRTPEELAAHYAKLAEEYQAKAEAKARGEKVQGNSLVSKLKARLRKTETALRTASITLNGVPADGGKGWSRQPIDEKIARTQERLDSQIETQRRAEFFQAKLPFDVKRLNALIKAIEEGEDVNEFPSGLTPLNRDEKTDEEHEAAHIASMEGEGA